MPVADNVTVPTAAGKAVTDNVLAAVAAAMTPAAAWGLPLLLITINSSACTATPYEDSVLVAGGWAEPACRTCSWHAICESVQSPQEM
jgi:hypothetical protein